MPDEGTLNRRDFFRHLGLAALAGAPACGVERVDPAHDPWAIRKPPVPGAEKWTRFEEKELATSCAQCFAGCGIRVRVVEGRAVAINGEVDNPVNRGGIGPRGRSGLQVLYDPDRIRQPLRRKGSSLEPVSWDEAVGELAERLSALRERGEPHRLAVACGREWGTMREMFERFALAYGTPNFLDGLPKAAGAVAHAIYVMQGIRDLPAYDWTSTRYVLSLGAGILEATCQAIYFARAASHLRRGRPTTRAKIVQVEPSHSRTAANADEWISIVPGTQAAFALGIAHVLVRDEAYDREFVETRGFGFDDWTDEAGGTHRGFRNLLLSDYLPEKVAAVCGIEPRTLERIAGEIAEARPAFAITDPRTTNATNGLQVAMAVHALNALLGAIDRPGGLIVQRPAPLAAWPDVELDEIAGAGRTRPRLDGVGTTRFPLATSATEALPDAIIDDAAPYGLDTLLLYYLNPLYSGMNPERWRRALAKIPFVVTFTPFLDETAAEVAHLVLPDHTYLERFEDAAPAPSVGFPVFGVRQPVVEPLHDTRHTGDVVIGLAGEIGGAVADAFPWKDYRTALFERIGGLREAERGSIEETAAPKFLRELFQRGFWEAPSYEFGRWEEVLRTPSGRFEFFSQRLRNEIGAMAARGETPVEELLRGWGRPEDPELACFPHHAAITWDGEGDAYPLLLDPYKPGTYAEGSGANLPLLQELVTEPGHSAWKTMAEIHPETARRAGVRRGDRIAIESPAGEIVLPVHVDRGVRADVVRIAQGGGHTAFGRFAAGRGANVMSLVVPRLDPFGGFPALHGTRVRIRKVTA